MFTREALLAAGAGRDADKVVAQRLGLSRCHVGTLRRQHGITGRFPDPRTLHKTREQIEAAGAGRLTDAEIARNLGVAIITGRRWRKIYGFPRIGRGRGNWSHYTRAQLVAAGAGVDPDRVVGPRLGMQSSSVGTLRRRMGIASTRRAEPAHRVPLEDTMRRFIDPRDPQLPFCRRPNMRLSSVQRPRSPGKSYEPSCDWMPPGDVITEYADRSMIVAEYLATYWHVEPKDILREIRRGTVRAERYGRWVFAVEPDVMKVFRLGYWKTEGTHR